MPEQEPITRVEKFLNGEVGMTPITREEKILAGEDVETITRREYFLKKYRGGGGGDVTVVPLSVTENGTYSEEGKAYSPVNVNVPLPSNAYLLKSVTTPTPIASFSDGEEMVMPTLKVAIEPQQDLHGYDSPWVGGAGKNKLKYPYYASSTTINGVTFTVNDDGTVKVNGTANADTSFYLAYTGSDMVLQQGEYTLNGCPSGGSNTTYMLNITNISTQDTGSGANFTSDGTTSLNIRIIVRANTTASNLLFKPMIRLASVSDATFAPYSNICPISGHTEENVTRCGKNLSKSQTNNSVLCSAKKGVTYTLSYEGSAGANIKKNTNSGEVVIWGPQLPLTFTADEDFNIYLNAWNANISNIQVEVGSQATTYEPYAGTTYTIDLDGTRYGGELDVVNGIVTPAPYYASYNGEALTGEWISDRDKYEVGTTPTIGAQVVNIGASGTPVSILPTVIKSLRGVNNLWADTGDVLDVEYFSKEV